ncbi:tRNA dimethylallyltransferase 1 [Spirochaetia bacterium]|nr:tRNA dimethylallyltransferase 1 [Spirochaetia bacterium]
MIPVFVLFGPTASGKTEILEKLFTGNAAFERAEVISADSMQVYRGMDIGTAKPQAQTLEKMPHHIIDIKEPDEQFNAGEFVRYAQQAVDIIISHNALPVISGGAGFYLKNFIEGISAAPPSDMTIRTALHEELSAKGAAVLMEELKICDPVSSGNIHVHDTYRLLRALEVFRLTAQPLSSFTNKNTNNRNDYKFLLVGLEWDRPVLYRRIDKRCGLMFKQGLCTEVKTLFEKGYTPENSALKAIGYKEFFVKDENSAWRLSDDIEGVEKLTAQNSRRYAKRQITWFKNVQNVHWIKLDTGDDSISCAVEKIKCLLSDFFKTGFSETGNYGF